MKKMSILVPALGIGALLSAMVIAAPLSNANATDAGAFPNRAEAYFLATAS